MNKNAQLFIAISVIIPFIYLATAFVVFDLNAANWSSWTRFSDLIALVILGFMFAIGIYGD